MQNSQGYIQETALSRRVKDWEDKIRPELELQVQNPDYIVLVTPFLALMSHPDIFSLCAFKEERPMFDIHDYGDRIVRSLGSVGNHQRFSSIVQGLDNFEACKYLLASLQLVSVTHNQPSSPLLLHTSSRLFSLHLRPTTTRWRWTASKVWRRVWTQWG